MDVTIIFQLLVYYHDSYYDKDKMLIYKLILKVLFINYTYNSKVFFKNSFASFDIPSGISGEHDCDPIFKNVFRNQ